MFSEAALSLDRPVNVLRINLLDQPGIPPPVEQQGGTHDLHDLGQKEGGAN